MFERLLDLLNDAIAKQAMVAVDRKDPSMWQVGHASGVVDGLRMAQDITRQAAREDIERDRSL